MKKYKWLAETEDIPYCKTQVRNSLKVKRKLYSGKSLFQKIEVYDTFTFGRILVLDGIFQTSEKDEFVYHEMLCHLPMFYHQNPKKVLIVGGGDGGALEETLKHPIEKVWMVEIDGKVIEISKKYLPSISKGAFQNKRAEVITDDGVKFVKKHKNFFDVIVLDLSDPAGPAKQVISLDFYRNIKKSLKKNGVVSVQGGCFFYQPKLIPLIYQRLKKVFSSVIIHRAPVVLYGLGEENFTVASDMNLRKVNLKNIAKRLKNLNLNLKYYTPEIHSASAVLPKYLMKKLKIK